MGLSLPLYMRLWIVMVGIAFWAMGKAQEPFRVPAEIGRAASQGPTLLGRS